MGVTHTGSQGTRQLFLKLIPEKVVQNSVKLSSAYEDPSMCQQKFMSQYSYLLTLVDKALSFKGAPR